MTSAIARARSSGGVIADAVDADRVVPAASTVKVLVALAFWRAALAGEVDATSRPALGLAGDGALLDHLPGLAPTLAHCCTLMLAVSDNSATNALVDAVGLPAVQAEAAALGLAATRVARRMADATARAAGRENTTSAADLARLMAALADPLLVPAPVARRVVAGLAASEHRDVIGEAALGLADEVYPKRGSLPDAEHDCALVRIGGRWHGVAVCSSPAAPPDALRAAAGDLLRACRGG